MAQTHYLEEFGPHFILFLSAGAGAPLADVQCGEHRSGSAEHHDEVTEPLRHTRHDKSGDDRDAEDQDGDGDAEALGAVHGLTPPGVRGGPSDPMIKA